MSRRLLTDALPLRRTTELDTYRADVMIPWVYGRVWLAPIPLDAAGLEYLIADGAITSVEAVQIAGAETDGYALDRRLDAAGQAVSVLRLTQAPQDGDAVAVYVVGHPHPVTGAPIEHPADVAADLLRRGGWTVPADAFQGLRDTWPALTVGQVFANPVTLRAALEAMIAPLGAGWTADLHAALLAPGGAPVLTLDALHCDEISAEASADDFATVLRVAFDYDWAAGRARQSLTVIAPELVRERGRIVADLDIGAVRSGRDALDVARQALSRRAGARWRVSAVGTFRHSSPALLDTVDVDHPHVPAGAGIVTARRYDRRTGITVLELDMPVGPPPRIELERMSRAIDRDADQLLVTYQDGVLRYYVLDPAGRPIAGAAVSIDGTETRYSDTAGLVEFTTTPGVHTLTIVAAGYATQELEVFSGRY